MPSKIESYERFNNYFKTVEFVKWDDSDHSVSFDNFLNHLVAEVPVSFIIIQQPGCIAVGGNNLAWIEI